MARIMIVFVALLAIAAPQPVDGQSQPGHVYGVAEWKALPGQEGAYGQVWQEFLRPLLDRMIQDGTLVSYLDLVKTVGNMADFTHLQLYEFQDWNTYGQFLPNLDEVSRSVFGRSFAELQAEEFVPLRLFVTLELYIAPPTPM